MISAHVRARTSPSLMSGHSTIWPCTSMSWSSRARSQRRLVAPRGLRSMPERTVRVRGVNRHVQRPEPLLDDPGQVELGEAGERREVAVQERQAIVVVLEVQRLAHARVAAGR